MTVISSDHWADVLALREEVVDRHGAVADLQMSLYSAVFHTEQVPYRNVGYYGEITQPTAKLIDFMASIAARLGAETQPEALHHLDQGMGGGKSHALVGLYHLATNPEEFFATELGSAVRSEAAERIGDSINIAGTRAVVLTADHMTPGTPSPEYGPARSLYERFLWRLFDGHEEPYDRYRAEGANKASIRRALEEVHCPVLILLDELMDYALKLSGGQAVAAMPDEQAFLADLMEAVNQVPNVAFVLVMIRSDLDEHGYNEYAAGFREYTNGRIERNGRKVAVTEPQDFRSIIRRRIFKVGEITGAVAALAEAWNEFASEAWRERVFEQIGNRRSLTGFAGRLEETYPFHPDLMALVEDDWARHVGFQRVRSTVRIFAASAHHWYSEHEAGRWSPPLIGPGDVPLERATEEVLSSGLLRDNERAIQSFRSVVAGDVISITGEGKAVALDRQFIDDHSHLPHMHPCLRIATALFLYSLVPRAQAKSGATKAELLAAAYLPDTQFTYTDAEEALSLLTHEEDGLGALDPITTTGASTPSRYLLSIKQTLRMFFKQAKAQIRQPDDADELIWQRVRTKLANQGRFDKVVYLDADDGGATRDQRFAALDERSTTRLVILDPHRWSLLNGEDGQSRRDIEALLGLGHIPMDNAASCVIACVNTYRRRRIRERAVEVVAYTGVLRMLDEEHELRPEAERKESELRKKLEQEVQAAFQHYCYLIRGDEGATRVDWKRFASENRTAINGNHVWDALVTAHRAADVGTLAGSYLPTLLDVKARAYTIKEVVTRFWQDPVCPLVASVGDLRRAIYEAVTDPDLSGHPPWQIVSDSGEVLHPTSPDALAISAMNQFIRPYAEPDAHVDGDGETGGDGGNGEDEGNDNSPGAPTSASTYKRYMVRLPNRSIVQDAERTRIYDLLLALTDALQLGGADIQLADITINLTAAQDSLGEISEKADEAGAAFEEHDEDFGG